MNTKKDIQKMLGHSRTKARIKATIATYNSVKITLYVEFKSRNAYDEYSKTYINNLTVDDYREIAQIVMAKGVKFAGTDEFMIRIENGIAIKDCLVSLGYNKVGIPDSDWGRDEVDATVEVSHTLPIDWFDLWEKGDD